MESILLNAVQNFDKVSDLEMQKAKEDAEDVLDNYLKPFDMVVDMYYPNNMKKEEFDKFLEDTGYSKGE